MRWPSRRLSHVQKTGVRARSRTPREADDGFARTGVRISGRSVVFVRFRSSTPPHHRHRRNALGLRYEGCGGRRVRALGDVSARRRWRPIVLRPTRGGAHGGRGIRVDMSVVGPRIRHRRRGLVNKPWQLRFTPHSSMRYIGARVSRKFFFRSAYSTI